MEFFKAYLIEFNFNIFCGAPDDISRRTGVPRRIGWEPLNYPIILLVVTCVFLFRTSFHKHTRREQSRGVERYTSRCYAVSPIWKECLPHSTNAQRGSYDAYIDKQKDGSPGVTGCENCKRMNMIFRSHMETSLT